MSTRGVRWVAAFTFVMGALGTSAPATVAGPGTSAAPGVVAPGLAAQGLAARLVVAPGTGPVAPTSAAGFKPRQTLVPMGFPLRASAAYHYASLWRVPRLGVVYPYNQIRGVTAGGALLRAHDGVDLAVPVGTIVLAPFAGVVVDPAQIWNPWDPARYGRVVVIRSTESASLGYYAMLVHLSRQSVAVGQAVKRGQVVGRTGLSGNAAETVPHLHFELRTPFRVEFHYAGVTRLLDSFDPLPSLRAADPHQ